MISANSYFLKALNLLLVIVAILSITWVLLLVQTRLNIPPQRLWLGLSIVSVVAISFIGTWATTATKGFLIDEQNRLSLARLQMTLWFVLLITTTASVAVARYTVDDKTLEEAKVRINCEQRYADDAEKRSHCGDPIQWLIIVIPEELLLAAGLSVGAAVAKAFVSSAKRNPGTKSEYLLNQEHDRLIREQEHQKSALAQVAQRAVETQRKQVDLYALKMRGQPLDETGRHLGVFRNRRGQLQANPKPAEARVKNLVHGNEVWNFDRLDLSKLQALVITGLLLSLYGLAVWRFLASPGDLYDPVAATLPSFSGSLLTLLTIALAGYVGVQAADHTSPQIELPPPTQAVLTSAKWSMGEVQAPVDGVTWVVTVDGTSFMLNTRYAFASCPSCDWAPKLGDKLYFQEPNHSSLVNTIIIESGEVITAKQVD